MMPMAIASTESSTATTPAMPMTMTNEVPKPLRQAAQVHGGDGADLFERVHVISLQRPASASTMLSRFARHAGGKPLTSASSSRDDRASQQHDSRAA